MARMSRRDYATLYGPTKGDAIRLGDTSLLAEIEHPGIVPVYGLGHDATGRPFYAMRFIQGDSLKEAIAAYHADEALRKDPASRSSR